MPLDGLIPREAMVAGSHASAGSRSTIRRAHCAISERAALSVFVVDWLIDLTVIDFQPLDFAMPLVYDFAFFVGLDLPEPLTAIASRTSALKAEASTSSPSGISIARRTLPSRLELKRPAGSFRDAPLAKVSFTTFL